MIMPSTTIGTEQGEGEGGAVWSISTSQQIRICCLLLKGLAEQTQTATNTTHSHSHSGVT